MFVLILVTLLFVPCAAHLDQTTINSRLRRVSSSLLS
jgi:hypothetical protein